MTSDELLTVAEVAEILKLNQQTVRNMLDRGDLPAVRVGTRRVRIRRSDLDELLAEGKRLTQRSAQRVVFDNALGAASKALRNNDSAAAPRGSIASSARQGWPGWGLMRVLRLRGGFPSVTRGGVECFTHL